LYSPPGLHVHFPDLDCSLQVQILGLKDRSHTNQAGFTKEWWEQTKMWGGSRLAFSQDVNPSRPKIMCTRPVRSDTLKLVFFMYVIMVLIRFTNYISLLGSKIQK
jgi:hypothetical protein